ncbi:MAG: hypothetical protein ACXAEX_19395 [Promethearchaeota archaeon]|jgi:tetratricopeptide (TPR) repeat protein
MESTFNYPPEEIIKPIFGKPNYEFIILWILNSNVKCTWGNLKEKVKHSTLSTYLTRLKDREYVEKSGFNQYRITSKGKDRYYELSEVSQKKRKLNFPPDTLLRRRNYDHWILWMLNNNPYCKWLDFSEAPLSINQSSLSKKLNSLIDNNFVRKEEKEYRITRLGKTEYSTMLRLYDLDRQSILEEESKRIREITKNITGFFKEYEIVDTDIKFRFLNNKVKLPYETLKSTLDNEEDYDKVLLFLSMNHPGGFPSYISPEEFSEKYGINLIKLKFVILRIVEENIFPIQFFKLETADGKIFYFQANQKLEQMLSAIVEDHITKFTYLNDLSDGTSEAFPPLTMERTVDVILSEITENLFNPSLKSALRRFLPGYINFLAYKIKKETKLIGTLDKLEGLIWEEIQYFDFSETKEGSDKRFDLSSYLDPSKDIKEVLEEINKAIDQYPNELDLLSIKTKILIYFDQYDDAMLLLDKMLIEFPENEKDLKMKKAFIFKTMRDLDGGFEIIEDLIKKYPEDNDLLNYKAMWYQYLNNKEEALNLIKNLIRREPNNAIFHDSYGEILMASEEYKLAIERFQTVIELDPKGWYLYQTYIKLGICYRELEDYDLAIKNLKKGKELIDFSPSDNETKQIWHSYADPFIAEITVLLEDF